MSVWLRCLPFTVAVVFWGIVSHGTASAECPSVDTEISAAQSALRNAEPARDGTRADFERRIGLVDTAYTHATAAETIRSTTPGGCGNIQQVYQSMLTLAWADIMFSYLKPSFEYYVNDPHCVAISHVQTQTMLLEAYETLNHSLTSWNPFDPGVIATREHVTKLVGTAALYLKIGLPSQEHAEDFARQYRYELEDQKRKTTVDCVTAVTDTSLPKTIAQRVFTNSQ